jgi:hypothetical protein
VSSRRHVITDEALDALAESPVIARNAWCIRRHEELAAEGALPTIPAEALAALRAIEIEP